MARREGSASACVRPWNFERILYGVAGADAYGVGDGGFDYPVCERPLCLYPCKTEPKVKGGWDLLANVCSQGDSRTLTGAQSGKPFIYRDFYALMRAVMKGEGSAAERRGGNELRRPEDGGGVGRKLSPRRQGEAAPQRQSS